MRGSYVFYNTLGPGRIGGHTLHARIVRVLQHFGARTFFCGAHRTCFTTLWSLHARIVRVLQHFGPRADRWSHLARTPLWWILCPIF